MAHLNQKMLYLDPHETDEFIKNLPKGTSLSEIVRQFIHDENERIKTEKKGTPPSKGALNNIENSNYKYLYTNRKQSSLDMFEKVQEIHKDYQEFSQEERRKFRNNLNQIIVNVVNIHRKENQHAKYKEVIIY